MESILNASECSNSSCSCVSGFLLSDATCSQSSSAELLSLSLSLSPPPQSDSSSAESLLCSPIPISRIPLTTATAALSFASQALRLNRDHTERRSRTYLQDTSHALHVCPPMPRLKVEHTPLPNFLLQGELVKLVVTLTNEGQVGLCNAKVRMSLPHFFCFGTPDEVDEVFPRTFTAAAGSASPQEWMRATQTVDPLDVVPLDQLVGSLGPGESARLPLWVYGAGLGDQTFRHVYYYESVQPNLTLKYRLARVQMHTRVVPSLTVNCFAKESLTGLSSYVLGLEVCNVHGHAAFRLAQISALSDRWTVELLSGGTAPPSASANDGSDSTSPPSSDSHAQPPQQRIYTVSTHENTQFLLRVTAVPHTNTAVPHTDTASSEGELACVELDDQEHASSDAIDERNTNASERANDDGNARDNDRTDREREAASTATDGATPSAAAAAAAAAAVTSLAQGAAAAGTEGATEERLYLTELRLGAGAVASARQRPHFEFVGKQQVAERRVREAQALLHMGPREESVVAAQSRLAGAQHQEVERVRRTADTLDLLLCWETGAARNHVGQHCLPSVEFLPQEETDGHSPLRFLLAYKNRVEHDFEREPFCSVEVRFLLRNTSSQPLAFDFETLLPTDSSSVSEEDTRRQYVWRGVTRKHAEQLPPSSEMTLTSAVCFVSPGVYNLNRFTFAVHTASGSAHALLPYTQNLVHVVQRTM
jgi:hypothetical protein